MRVFYRPQQRSVTSRCLHYTDHRGLQCCACILQTIRYPWALFVNLEALPEPYPQPEPFLWHKCGTSRNTLKSSRQGKRCEFQFHIYIYRNNLQIVNRIIKTAAVDMNCIPFQSCSFSTLLVIQITVSSSP